MLYEQNQVPFGNWIILKRKGTKGYCSMIGTNTCDMADEDSLKQGEKKCYLLDLASLI